MSLLHLNSMSLDQLRAWLKDALNERVPVPRLTPDERPDIAILACEGTLDKLTRRDLETACCDLVHEFTRSGEGSRAYVRAVLHLAVGLQLRDRLAGALAAMPSHLPNWPHLERAVQQTVLLTLVDLKAVQPAEFWLSMLAQDGDAFAGAALAGMLANSWEAGLSILPRLPERESFASAAAILIGQALEDLPPAHRTGCLRDLEAVLPSCSPALRDALHEVVEEYRGNSPPHTQPHGTRAALAACRKYPELAPCVGPSRKARLAA
ncbi:hypothetical protein [Nannocystis pusilla]|uniref:Uncharacterized protein n=1 Tax=Nannocystis pusilla TaxID=889268 RepID=A0ABS7TZS2_9BACT|nr:hypothetical protein [Nannocystis pusilla]MBZ5713774.1 hypothetical protein [Nannocystis pusilla]